MKYLFKIWAWQPLFTEVVIEADSEEIALNKVKSLDNKTLSWVSDPMRKERTTYEVFVESHEKTIK